MKFSTTTIVALATFIQTVLADSRPISVVSAHSASNVHLLSLHDDGEGLLLGKGTAVGITITDAGAVKFSNGKYAVIDKDGYLADGDENQATLGWTIEHGTFALNGNQMFYAVPTSDKYNYKVSTKSVGDSTYIHFIGATSDSNRDYTYVPKGSANTSASNSTTSAAPAPKTTATVQQNENGANKLGLGLTAGIAGVAALLL